MTEATATRDDYDSPWKEVLEHAFPEFIAELGKRFADALVQITLTSGEQSRIKSRINRTPIFFDFPSRLIYPSINTLPRNVSP